MKSYKFDQISIVTAITTELSRQHPSLPADHRMNAVIAASNSIVAEYEREPVMAAPRMGVSAWLDSDDTGASSLFMAYVLCHDRLRVWRGRKAPGNHYPRDPDDLGRCIRLIEAVPEFEGLIPEMADRSAHWTAVTSNWADWVYMYQTGDTVGLYTAMKDAFAKVDAG
ncbi:TPA: hypothetical protein KNH08_002085 [Serratia fonticola]|nr:hypothetical protein [Serratia fonticola]